MLRAKDRDANTPRPQRSPLLAAGLLAVVALAATALRGPAEQKKEKPRPGEVPVELRFLPPEAHGLVVVRPAELLGSIGLKKIRDDFNGSLALFFKELEMKDPGFRFEDVEQVTMYVHIRTDPRAEKPQTSVMTWFGPVRLVRPVDWKKWLGDHFGDLKELKEGDRVFYRVTRVIPALGPFPVCLYPVDGRTLLIQPEEELRRSIREDVKGRAVPAWLAGWDELGDGAARFALDTRNRKWLDDREQPEDSLSSTPVVLLRHSTAILGVLSLDGGKVTFRAAAWADTEKDRRTLADAWRDCLIEHRKGLRGRGADELVPTLLKQDAVEEKGGAVWWKAEATGTALDLIQQMPTFPAAIE